MPLTTALADPEGSLARPIISKLFRVVSRDATRRIHALGLRGAIALDGDDVANAVLLDLHLAAKAGRIRVSSEGELSGLALWMAHLEILAIRQRTRALRRGGRGRAGPAVADPSMSRDQRDGGTRPPRESLSLDEVADRVPDPRPSPERFAIVRDEADQFVGLFAEPLWVQIARCRIDGYTIGEIAERTGLSACSIDRRLRIARVILESRRSREPDGG